uniref:Bm168 n=1 Tax=Brugia malayi TaxID=6279 RepID=A0A1I9FZX8_BRUMA|nr:Bm168 [Brugia malayi]
MFLQWLMLWYTLAFAVCATEFGHLRRSGKIPWYLSTSVSSNSGILTNYDSSNWNPYQTIDRTVIPQHRQIATSDQNSATQLLENNGELLWNIRNALQKITSQINVNDLRPIWNSIQNGALGEKIEMFLQQQQRERQFQRNGYDTIWKQSRQSIPFP